MILFKHIKQLQKQLGIFFYSSRILSVIVDKLKYFNICYKCF